LVRAGSNRRAPFFSFLQIFSAIAQLFGGLARRKNMADALPVPAAPLSDDPVVLQGMIRELLTVLAAERRNREQLERRLDQLLRHLYGPHSEQRSAGPTLFDDCATPVADAPPPPPPLEPVTSTAPPQQNGHGRRKLPADLPRQRIEHDLSEAEKVCPCCAAPRVKIGEEISERLDYTPSQLQVIEHVRPKYLCRKCQGEIAIAPLPPEPIAKAIAAPGLLAHVIVSKFADHLPLYRQEKIFARSGLELPRSTLCDWLAGCAEVLQPLYALMVKRVLQAKVIHTDDTPVRLLQNEESKTGRMWVYLGNATHPYTVYEATPNRSRDGPMTFLKGFKGYLQADAFSGYDRVYAQGVTEVACWAHARRKFVEAESSDAARAAEAMARIRSLYAVEDRARSLAAPQRAELRQVEAAPRLESLRQWLNQLQKETLPKSPLGQAVAYVQNQWTALTVYLTDGDLAIDNNAAERALRGTAVGRKNWLFFGSETGGQTAAVLTSFIATCQRHAVNPWQYLKDVLTRLPACKQAELPNLLPDAWSKAQHAAAEPAKP
jgi:transposase